MYDGRFTLEKSHSLVYGHVQDIRYVFFLILYIEYFLLKPFSFAGFACQKDIRHKLHFDLLRALALAGLTAPTIHIEAKKRGLVTSLFGETLFRKKVSDRIIGLHIGDGIRSGGLSDGILVHKFDLRNLFIRSEEHTSELQSRPQLVC